MKTPIADFLKAYQTSGLSRLHMPGHKGIPFLGPEPMDITEIKGADSLYEAQGIIAQSEANASQLFGSERTVYSTEGSSQCIRAMLCLASMASGSTTVLAARNVHKAFVYAAALLDLDVIWLWPDRDTESLCSCNISAASLESALSRLQSPPAAVYVTSPDYLGGRLDIRALAEVCHKYNTLLAVDNAHGAYLHFLPQPSHPVDMGADICCDSAHKTLPVLTGGAYLHISNETILTLNAKSAMSLFGSTSPSYLILASLDMCNAYLSETYRERLLDTVSLIDGAKQQLRDSGWEILNSDPLKLTIRAPWGITGYILSDKLRSGGVECEYADRDHVVMMATAETSRADIKKITDALGPNDSRYYAEITFPAIRGEKVMSIRQAVLAPQETIVSADARGRICAMPTVSCPPAIPVVVSGERITAQAVEALEYYGIDQISVVK